MPMPIQTWKILVDETGIANNNVCKIEYILKAFI